MKFELDPTKLDAARKEADEVHEMLSAHKIKITTIVKDHPRKGAVVECRKYRDGDIAGYFETHDCWIDEFDTEKEALDFIAESKNA